jgi:hypothetical protein
MQSIRDTKPNRHKSYLLIILTLTTSTLLILAAGLSGLEFLPARPFPLAGILQLFGDIRLRFSSNLRLPDEVVYALTGCLWLMLIVSVIALIVSPEIRKNVLKRTIAFLIWALMLVALMRAFQAGLISWGQIVEGPAQKMPPDLTSPTELIPTPPDFILNPPQWFVIGATILLITILLSLTWGVWRFVSGLKSDGRPLDKLAQEAQDALNRLQAGANLKDTIMRCYAEMSHTLSAERNLHRQAGMTPREFEDYLAQSGLRSDHIHRLTRLFESARYSNKTASPQQEEEAIACLSAIAQAYGASS